MLKFGRVTSETKQLMPAGKIWDPAMMAYMYM